MVNDKYNKILPSAESFLSGPGGMAERVGWRFEKLKFEILIKASENDDNDTDDVDGY